MKRLATILAVTLAATAAVSAQPWTAPPWGQPQGQTVKVEGRLALVNGAIAVQAGAKTYYVPRLARLAGFIEGIKEGAAVKLEGYESALPYAPNYSFLAVTKLTVGGKDYDLGQFAGPRMAPGAPQRGMRGRGRW